MKFSVVIPCHNRLPLLKKAVKTVMEQKYQDWELCIFDNSSEDPLQSALQKTIGSQQSKVRFARSDTFLSVTESWNRAIAMASNEYIVFLGDDDGLVPAYFERMSQIIAEFSRPDVIYSALYQLLYPGVAPWDRSGYVMDLKNAFFFEKHEKPFLLSLEKRKKAVQGSLKLRRNFTFNIQAFLFRREFLHSICQNGHIFQSSFPDYYIANIALSKADKVVVVPKAMAIAGVSKESVGYALFNGLENRFTNLLNTQILTDPWYVAVKDYLLPGFAYNTNYLLSMMHVFHFLPDFFCCEVDVMRYRKSQIYHAMRSCRDLKKNYVTYDGWSSLTREEKAWARRVFWSLGRFAKKILLGKTLDKYYRSQSGMISFVPKQEKIPGSFDCIEMLFKKIANDTLYAD